MVANWLCRVVTFTVSFRLWFTPNTLPETWERLHSTLLLFKVGMGVDRSASNLTLSNGRPVFQAIRFAPRDLPQPGTP
jgi:hypothetical protein